MFAARMKRKPINRASVIGALLLSSCTMQMTQAPGGGMTVTHMEVRQPGFIPRAILPGRQTVPESPFMPGSLDGTFTGVASPLGSAGARCLTNQDVNNFHVSGNSVRWGGFRGTIDRNGGVQMTHGGNWVYGEFIGTQFSGVLEQAAGGGLRNRHGPACSYRLLLQRG